jgi:hypothetical protein
MAPSVIPLRSGYEAFPAAPPASPTINVTL